jgi:hypothetical protein
MSRLDELPPDQRAALALLLSQGKSYADVAALLGIGDRAVHDRAHAALTVLAPAQARGLSAEERERIGEHLLGQQSSVADQLRTRSLLETSAPAREWARAVSSELGVLAPDGLPEIPGSDGDSTHAGAAEAAAAEAAAPPAAPAQATTAPAVHAQATAEPTVPPPAAPPPAAPTPAAPAPGSSAQGNGAPDTAAPVRAGRSGPSLPSSRVGGAIVLVALAGAVVAAVLLLSGGSSHHRAAGATTSATAGTGTGPSVTARIPMRSPNTASRSIGLLQILSEGSRRAFYVVAEHMPATRGFFYALWLYNNPSSQEPLGKAPPVGSNHRLEGGGALPANAGEFKEVLLTRETSTRPTHPGPVVLHGSFTLSG